MGFLIKTVVITICMFFVFYLFIQETVDIMTDNGGMNWVSFVTVVFTCVIGFVLTQNAPKIAQTLMTGQPQLSMGELVTAAGSLAMGTFKGVKAAGHITKERSRKVAHGAENVHGTAAKINSARKAAATQSNVNMTRQEFYDEKRDQGKNIGNTVALNMMTAAEKKEQAMKKETSLGDKLTDGVRASE